MSGRKDRVCPVERAGHLDNWFRRFYQNPGKIVGTYLDEGMTAIDLGCGPGYFTIEMAKTVGAGGRVFAVDLQDGMLEKVEAKIAGTALEKRITLHKCKEDGIGLEEPVDFILLFYVVHEVPDRERLFSEVESLLKFGGKALVVEPPFHVSKKDFAETISMAEKAGLSAAKGPKLFPNKSAILNKA